MSAGYPGAERIDLVDDYHGRPVADPYRWLEDAGDPRTQAWCAEQDEPLAWLPGGKEFYYQRMPAPGQVPAGEEGDTRVDPLHARKFAAALQHATSVPAAGRPILLRREFNVGHATRAVSRSIPLWLDQLCFFAGQLGWPDSR